MSKRKSPSKLIYEARRAAQATTKSDLDQSFKARIADAVHNAVCEFTGTDGVGQCDLYVSTGWYLLRKHTNLWVMPQAGTIGILADPPDVWYVMDGRNYQNGEIHCWLTAHHTRPPEGDYHGEFTFIDFSSRHYASYLGRMGMVENDIDRPIRWNTTFPDFLWFNTTQRRHDVLFTPVPECCAFWLDREQKRHRQHTVKTLHHLANKLFIGSKQSKPQPNPEDTVEGPAALGVWVMLNRQIFREAYKTALDRGMNPTIAIFGTPDGESVYRVPDELCPVALEDLLKAVPLNATMFRSCVQNLIATNVPPGYFRVVASKEKGRFQGTFTALLAVEE